MKDEKEIKVEEVRKNGGDEKKLPVRSLNLSIGIAVAVLFCFGCVLFFVF